MMTDPQQAHSEQLQSSADAPASTSGSQHQQQQSPLFQPVYTLVNNSSTRTTHHPHVHYIFSDDDPDILTQALSHQHEVNLDESASDPAPDQRAILLDLSQDKDGAFRVASASSLSPSWAVLNAQLSQTSPPASDNGGSGDGVPSPINKKSDRLMLHIEGIEGNFMASSGELRLSGEKNGLGPGSASGSHSDSHSGQRTTEEDYNNLVEEFHKRMATLKKVVDAGEERRRKVSEPTDNGVGTSDDTDNTAAHMDTDALSRSVDSG